MAGVNNYCMHVHGPAYPRVGVSAADRCRAAGELHSRAQGCEGGSTRGIALRMTIASRIRRLASACSQRRSIRLTPPDRRPLLGGISKSLTLDL